MYSPVEEYTTTCRSMAGSILMTEMLQKANVSIRVVQNWQEELKRLVPTK